MAAPLLAAACVGHGSMIMPPSRNAMDATLPPWQHGRTPPTGVIEPYKCACTNGTSGCDVGQACFWFSQGCTIGCSVCDGQGQRLPNWDHCPAESLEPTLNDPKYRTANLHAKAGSAQDIFKYNPWRAPGRAPVFDACGMAGGTLSEVFNAGAFNTTKYAAQGDLGSKVLPPRPSGTVWRRGGQAKARWQVTAQHGGGYQYRLCPASEPLTEACFQRTPLLFAPPYTHRVLFADATRDFDINATLVTEGGGKGWMRHPIPWITDSACDYVVPPGKHCPFKCPRCGPPWYAADGACPANCASSYPELHLDSTTGADPSIFPDPVSGHQIQDYAVEDTLLVPADIAPGEYVLGWRWDCEMTSQVWSTCADITID